MGRHTSDRRHGTRTVPVTDRAARRATTSSWTRTKELAAVQPMGGCTAVSRLGTGKRVAVSARIGLSRVSRRSDLRTSTSGHKLPSCLRLARLDQAWRRARLFCASLQQSPLCTAVGPRLQRAPCTPNAPEEKGRQSTPWSACVLQQHLLALSSQFRVDVRKVDQGAVSPLRCSPLAVTGSAIPAVA
jgi:hypothetical protein